MPELRLVPKPELDRLRAADVDPDARLALLADACRLNALVAVKRAGSGHLGSTFSALDVVTHLLFEELDVARRGFDDPDRDVFFSSKGHDVPGLYAALFALGVVPRERLLRLRRLGGLDGHPDVGVPGIEASSGSLGMGISKGRGIALAKRRLGREGRVVVMTGDGELQEGQNWEALQSAAHERLGRLWVVVDRNEVQSDKPTEEIVALGDLEAKLGAFGWDVETVDGHDHSALRGAFVRFAEGDDVPKALVARTIKGKGVSFMEHPAALAEGGGTYRWHAGAPDDDAFARASAELEASLSERCAALGLEPPAAEAVGPEAPSGGLEGEPESGAGSRRAVVTEEYVVEAYGEALLELAGERDDLVVLDADLASDCR
ncbi:MAG TPA: 1-deoxy-D-xylulose-5-phosphate synthase N-terminal domain-containing protein, partial [Gaiella sp.]|nr:1-deoxy-D-xylulose-5-phosphate synthase N-terminal domain-containing protein [Gaiella sp.]